jgi:SAM-dependent methyltransferase
MEAAVLLDQSSALLERVREFRELLWINLKVKARNFWDYLKVVQRYYWDWTFFKTDTALLIKYIARGPFAVSKQYLHEQGETEVYTYGETPLHTLEKILDIAEVGPQDTYLEAGCGRGRGCFWVHRFRGCHATGIDIVPAFIEKATQIRDWYDISGVKFRQQDMLEADFSSASVIYMYGICFDRPFIKKFVERMEGLPRGTKIITVSYPLTDYTDKPLFEVMKVFPASFTWGMADVYVQYKV